MKPLLLHYFVKGFTWNEINITFTLICLWRNANENICPFINIGLVKSSSVVELHFHFGIHIINLP